MEFDEKRRRNIHMSKVVVLKDNVTNFQCTLVFKKSSLQESQTLCKSHIMTTLQLRLQTSVLFIVLYDVYTVMNVCMTTPTSTLVCFHQIWNFCHPTSFFIQNGLLPFVFKTLLKSPPSSVVLCEECVHFSAECWLEPMASFSFQRGCWKFL